MAVVFALAAALCNALATVLERLGVQTAPADAAMKWKLIAHVLKRPVWFLGLLSMVGAFLFQVAALSRGTLTLVQPLLVTELLFLVVILRVWFAKPVAWREGIGAILTVVGLATFLLVTDQGGGDEVPSLTGWFFMLVAAGGLIVVTIIFARFGSRAWRAACYGTAAAVSFAVCAAFMKSTTTLVQSDGFTHLFAHFEPYGIAVAGLSGLFFAQNSYHAGPITASQAAIVIVDPIASIVIGVGLFGDTLASSNGVLALDAIALTIMSIGLVVLCHSPLIASSGREEQLETPALLRRVAE